LRIRGARVQKNGGVQTLLHLTEKKWKGGGESRKARGWDTFAERVHDVPSQQQVKGRPPRNVSLFRWEKSPDQKCWCIGKGRRKVKASPM